MVSRANYKRSCLPHKTQSIKKKKTAKTSRNSCDKHPWKLLLPSFEVGERTGNIVNMKCTKTHLRHPRSKHANIFSFGYKQNLSKTILSDFSRLKYSSRYQRRKVNIKEFTYQKFIKRRKMIEHASTLSRRRMGLRIAFTCAAVGGILLSGSQTNP